MPTTSYLVLFQHHNRKKPFLAGFGCISALLTLPYATVKETQGARVSVEIIPREHESFTNWMARGVYKSQKNKLARQEAITLLGGRWIRPCSSCGRALAQKVISYSQEDIHRLCGACLKKRCEIEDYYEDIKHNWDILIPIDKPKLKKEHPNHILTTLVHHIERQHGETIPLLLPGHFDHIGSRSQPTNYMGFIYADGNRMGEVIKSMGEKFNQDEQAKQAYQAFSAIVDKSTQEAAVEAVLRKVGTFEEKSSDNENGCLVPAEFVLAGGDDLILVVPAHTALDVATRFINLFQEKTKQLQEEWKKTRQIT